MQISIADSINNIAAEDWNRICGDTYPFLRHEFLIALERHQCLQPYGWFPQYFLAHDDEQLIAVMPMYIKDNSYGEFVFDWSWADAYHRSGLEYYPKLVCSIPYTPATGPRICVSDDHDYRTVANALIDAAVQHAQSIKASSVHWLFTRDQETALLRDAGYSLRLGCQFHWQNDAYTDFDDFLGALSSAKRKNIRRERRKVLEQDIQLEIRHGDEMSERDWQYYHAFYENTFYRKSGTPTLSLEFFMEIGRTMPRNVVVVFARHAQQLVASAFNVRGTHTLYGRHWGCSANYDSLHFEGCYYQGLDYCIANKLQRFEPGAQGEHKISRGFLPNATWSAHWLAHPEFKQIIQDFTQREQRGMQDYIEELNTHSPYRQSA